MLRKMLSTLVLTNLIFFFLHRTSHRVPKLKENKIVSGFSQTQQYIFILFLSQRVSVKRSPSGHLYRTQNKLHIVQIIFMKYGVP